MKKTFTAFVEYDDESKLYVGIIPNVPGAHTQAETLDEYSKVESDDEVCNAIYSLIILVKSLISLGTQQVEIAL